MLIWVNFNSFAITHLMEVLKLIKWGVRNPLPTRHFKNLSLDMFGSQPQKYCCELNSALFFYLLLQIYVKF